MNTHEINQTTGKNDLAHTTRTNRTNASVSREESSRHTGKSVTDYG
jgi:hypothetical protein